MRLRDYPVTVFSLCILLLVLTVNLSPGEIEVRGTPPEISDKRIPGYIPPRIGTEHLLPRPDLRSETLPSVWDWRSLGGVSAVKYQGNFGTCWAHTALADLESKVKIKEGMEYDYSEVNVIACNPSYTSGYTGGNSLTAVNYLSLWASVDESCDPYPGDLPYPDCVNPSCDFRKTVTEWRKIPNDVDALKYAIYHYGPVQTVVYTDNEFVYYGGSYCFSYPPYYPSNHNVLLVGWDNNLCGTGVGGWIVKNSYGSDWGDGGYFYILFGSGSIGENASVITGYKDFNPDETVYHLDQHGMFDDTGYGDGDDYAFVRITPTDDHWLAELNFWATSGPLSYSFSVYDSIDEGTLTDRLAGPLTGDLDEAGLYTVPLAQPVKLSNGDDIYILARLNAYGYANPIPIDGADSSDVNRSYIKNSAGDDWTLIDGGSSTPVGDIGIRARAVPHLDRGDPALYQNFGDNYVEVGSGDTLCWTLHPSHLGMYPEDACTDDDTFCLHVESARGWLVEGSPALEIGIYLEPGTLWFQDICLYIPQDAQVGDTDTLIATMTYYRNGACGAYPSDCLNPNQISGSFYYSTDMVVVAVDHITASPDTPPLPLAFRLGQNYPNPFNPSTRIEYDLPTDCRVKLVIFSAAGEKVATLVDRFQRAGTRTAVWDGRNDRGREAGSGIYYYRIQAGEYSASDKMVLLR
ncbi:MAG: hypothetical protein JXB45_09720 [Candidatus Krumholzibacteriota bacterium]|nr:hypothetical protein [Candidatus Krumholzibacteriota bacterium]